MNYILFTDGAYSSSRNKGGIGLLFVKDNKVVLTYSKGFLNTTNNKMELIAIIAGLRCITKPIDSLTVVSDSMYCIGIITLNWKRKKNVELWERFDRIVNFHKSVKLEWVKGHSNNPYNIRCDKLAVKATQINI